MSFSRNRLPTKLSFDVITGKHKPCAHLSRTFFFRRSFRLSRPGGNEEFSFAAASDSSMFNGLSIESTTKKQLPNDRLKRR